MLSLGIDWGSLVSPVFPVSPSFTGIFFNTREVRGGVRNRMVGVVEKCGNFFGVVGVIFVQKLNRQPL